MQYLRTHRGEFLGMRQFHRQDGFDQLARRCIVRADVLQNLAIAIDSDALSDQIFLEQIGQPVGISLLAVVVHLGAGSQCGRLLDDLAAKLPDPLGQGIGVTLLFQRVFEEFVADGCALGSPRRVA